MIEVVTLEELRETRRRMSAMAGNDVRRYAAMFLTPTETGILPPVAAPNGDYLTPTPSSPGEPPVVEA